MSKEEYLKSLSDCVLEMEDEKVVTVAEEYLREGHSALDGINLGLVDGMNRAGALYEQEEYFVTDLLLCSDAMYNGLDVLKPHLKDEAAEGEEPIPAVIGVVQGDTHDIGKNLVKIMFETAGFTMYDLGRDVPIEAFVDKAQEVNARLICLSTLMTTTMIGMQRVVELLKERGLYGKIKVMIGGGPVSKNFCDKIGADAYTGSAMEAVRVAKMLLNGEPVPASCGRFSSFWGLRLGFQRDESLWWVQGEALESFRAASSSTGAGRERREREGEASWGASRGGDSRGALHLSRRDDERHRRRSDGPVRHRLAGGPHGPGHDGGARQGGVRPRDV